MLAPIIIGTASLTVRTGKQDMSQSLNKSARIHLNSFSLFFVYQYTLNIKIIRVKTYPNPILGLQKN